MNLASHSESVEAQHGNGADRFTFDCGVIFVNEMTLYKLDGQARFAHASTANDDELVLSQKLQPGRVSIHGSQSRELPAKERGGLTLEAMALGRNQGLSSKQSVDQGCRSCFERTNNG